MTDLPPSPDSATVNPWYDAVAPEVSIIVLNFNGAALTADCLSQIHRHTSGRRFETIVVDNGSNPKEFEKLSRTSGFFRLIRLSTNRFFGEGNNIGAEVARGKFLVFLNNDAFVTENWLGPLICALEERPGAGGAGPLLLYPDGAVQEAGAYVDGEGRALQVGKFNPPHDEAIVQERIVDYCSAACFAVEKAIFERVGGFDLVYEPAYYEDADLCLKIAGLGLNIYFCPTSKVVHIEGGTSLKNVQEFGLGSVVEVNRRVFMERWGPWLEARAGNRAAVLPVPSALRKIEPRPRGRPKAILYSGFDLIPGGGERYLLSIAATLSETHETYLATDERYSRLRLGGLARELRIDLDEVAPIRADDASGLDGVDVSVVMGNEALPPRRGFGRRNYFMCQFPFPMTDEQVSAHWGHADSYETSIVNSQFTLDRLIYRRRSLNLGHLPVMVVSPPVYEEPTASDKPASGPIKILLIGRFFAGHHCKRHDVAIEALKALTAKRIDAELHLVGSLHQYEEHRRYYDDIRAMADGLPVVLHPNAPRAVIDRLLKDCTIYWHATGFEVDVDAHSERCEHFGISIVEAMSAGCVPFVVGNGGATEFVREGETGFLYASIPELAFKTAALIERPELRAVMARRARIEAEKYSDAAFADRWRALLGTPRLKVAV